MTGVRVRLAAAFLALAAGIVAVVLVVDFARSILG
jgi:hypothetical protein